MRDGFSSTTPNQYDKDPKRLGETVKSAKSKRKVKTTQLCYFRYHRDHPLRIFASKTNRKPSRSAFKFLKSLRQSIIQKIPNL